MVKERAKSIPGYMGDSAMTQERDEDQAGQWLQGRQKMAQWRRQFGGKESGFAN